MLKVREKADRRGVTNKLFKSSLVAGEKFRRVQGRLTKNNSHSRIGPSWHQEYRGVLPSGTIEPSPRRSLMVSPETKLVKPAKNSPQIDREEFDQVVKTSTLETIQMIGDDYLDLFLTFIQRKDGIRNIDSASLQEVEVAIDSLFARFAIAIKQVIMFRICATLRLEPQKLLRRLEWNAHWVAENSVRDFVTFFFREFTLPTLLKGLKLLADYGGHFEYEESTSGRIRSVLLKHGRGMKWSIHYGEWVRLAIERLRGLKVETEMTESQVSFRFPINLDYGAGGRDSTGVESRP